MKAGMRLTVLSCLALGAAVPARAQTGAQDSLRLGRLQAQAVAGDARQREFGLLAKQTELRLGNLSAERLPALAATAGGQYQSAVFGGGSLPAGLSFATPSRDTYDSRLEVEQSLFDPTRSPRRGVEQAKLAESEAGVKTALYSLRQEVNESFFNAALLTERSRIIAASIADLDQRLQETRVRVREGEALPGDAAAIQATLLERRQEQQQVEADRRAALARLTELTRQPLAADAPIALPDLCEETEQARQGLAQLRSRPEYEQFDRTRDRLAREQTVLSAELRPSVSAFGRAGYGRPGLNPVSDQFDRYYVLGLQVKWAPWNWGTTQRDRGVLAVQQRIVAAEEAAFTSELVRSIQSDVADIDRLDGALGLDDQIVALRQGVEDETRLRLREGVVTASEYLDRSTDVLQARLTRAQHQVEQVQARARLLTTLGLEIR